MSEELYHNYPDKNVPKKELYTEWFPMSSATCNRRLEEIRKSKKFSNVEVSTGGKTLINVRGFYLFLQYRKNNRFKV